MDATKKSKNSRVNLLICLALICALWPETSWAARRWRTNLEGQAVLLPTYYFEDVGQGTKQTSALLRVLPESSFRTSRSLVFRFSPWLEAEHTGTSRGDRVSVDINEAHVDWRRGDWRAKLGLNQVAWGVTDIFNPLDVVSARRYFDPLSAEKRAVPSLDIGFERDEWLLQLIYIPRQLESFLPRDDSRWLPREVAFNRTINDSTVSAITVAERFSYVYTDSREVNDALKNNVGLRTDYRGNGYDLTAVAFRGAPTAPTIATPIIDFELIGSTAYATQITLQPVYYTRLTGGFGAVLTGESTLWRMAYAYSDKTSDLRGLPGWSQSAVLGIEKNFAIGESTLTALLQTTYALHEDQGDNTIASVERIFDRAWILGLRMSTSDAWSYSAGGLFDSAVGGGFAQLKIDRKLNDGFSANLSGDWIDGSTRTALGTFKKNKRVTLGVTAYF